MVETIFLIITAFSAVSREIRAWIELQTRKKEEDDYPPFPLFLHYSPVRDNILYLT